jgi:hypothetical protein
MVPAMAAVAPEVVDRDVARMREDGFVVVEGLLSPAEVTACRKTLARHLARELFGRNPFQGLRDIPDGILSASDFGQRSRFGHRRVGKEYTRATPHR